jgi:hypothetical protein
MLPVVTPWAKSAARDDAAQHASTADARIRILRPSFMVLSRIKTRDHSLKWYVRAATGVYKKLQRRIKCVDAQESVTGM